MAKYTGTGMTVNYNTTAITANHVKSVTISSSHAVADSTGASDTNDTGLPTYSDSDVTIELLDDTAPATIWDIFPPRTSATLIISPDGVKTRTVTAIVTGRERGEEFNATVPISVTLKASGAWS